MKIEEVILKPILTEKIKSLERDGVYGFLVHKDANKKLIKKAIEKIFKVKVKKVRIINVKPKKRQFLRKEGKKSGYKKALVFLEKGEKIEI
jgi:large subunit ribosomal protein L23